MLKVEELTSGEKLLLQRRRLCETQRDAAIRFGVSYVTYNKWENNRVEKLPNIKITTLEPFECCLLYRRRANISQTDMARELQVSRWWLSLMEQGVVPCEVLLKYWEISPDGKSHS